MSAANELKWDDLNCGTGAAFVCRMLDEDMMEDDGMDGGAYDRQLEDEDALDRQVEDEDYNDIEDGEDDQEDEE